MIVQVLGGTVSFVCDISGDLACTVSSAACDYRHRGQNVWCYTGYTLEECLADPARRECLRWIDTLVDGRYVEALRDLSLDFRGSSNQRIIDVGALHLFG